MADELFLLAPPRATARRFDRRPGLPVHDQRKSCGSRFLRNLETAIFGQTAELTTGDARRGDDVDVAPPRLPTGDLARR